MGPRPRGQWSLLPLQLGVSFHSVYLTTVLGMLVTERPRSGLDHLEWVPQSEFLSPQTPLCSSLICRTSWRMKGSRGSRESFYPWKQLLKHLFSPKLACNCRKAENPRMENGHKRPAFEKRKREGTPGAGPVRGDGFAFQGRTKQIEVEKMYFRRICQKNLSQQSYSEPPASRPPSPQIM